MLNRWGEGLRDHRRETQDELGHTHLQDGRGQGTGDVEVQAEVVPRTHREHGTDVCRLNGHEAPGEFLGESSPNLAEVIGIWMMQREAHDGGDVQGGKAEGRAGALIPGRT